MASAEPSEMPMIEHALAYLEQGYPVFPVCSPKMSTHYHGQTICTNPGKTPLVPWAPFQERLPTDPEVRVWWIRWPNANIGMATGVLSGVLVLDADGGDARKECLRRGGLDATRAVWTGKVGGAHYHLAYPGGDIRNFARRLPGTDMRAQGGYVLMPPSLHASGNTYKWIPGTEGLPLAPVPEWLNELIHERGPDFGAASEGEYREPLDTEEALKGFPEGQRDDGLFRFACRLRHDDVPYAHAEALVLTAARNCTPAFPDRDAVAKVRHVYQTYPPGEVGPEVDVAEDEWFSPPNSRAQAEPETEKPPAIFLRPIEDLLSAPVVEPDWMVDQLFTVGSNGWVAAEPKVGKSWIVLELAYALSTGTPFLGKFAVKQRRRVIYIQEEDSFNRVRGRLDKIISGDRSRGRPTGEYWRWSIREGFKVDNLAWLEKLRQEIIAFQAEVVILDVFNRLHGSDDSKQQEMTAILNNLTRLTNDYGCSFIIVHHNKKSQAGVEARANQMMRGSTVLAGWSECSLYLRKGKEKHVFIVTPESKDAPEMDDFSVTIRDLDEHRTILEVGMVSIHDRTAKMDEAVVDAVRRLNLDGLDATVQRVSDLLKKERSGVSKRLKSLVDDGILEEDEVQMGRVYVKIYTVVTL